MKQIIINKQDKISRRIFNLYCFLNIPHELYDLSKSAYHKIRVPLEASKGYIANEIYEKS